MSISPEDWQSLSKLLDEALDVAPEKREAWLTALAPSASAFRDELRRLLASHSAAASQDFLGTLPKDASAGPAGDSDPLLHEGALVGPYRLVRELGRGGMGTVWLAERDDGILKRPVALKLTHSTLPHRELAERLARERDILAALTHPNIARLYDAGVAARGQPYLALEVIEGRPIGEYCDQHSLGIDRRVDLFAQVLSAVQYAHGQLVVHRDLKPSNILVTREGEVKLLDFGIAKLLTDGEAKETALTQRAGRALTPDYASPEQIAGRAIGTASDVYALGVVLFELLTGSRPYRLTRDSRGALEDAILTVDAVRPSQSPIDEAQAKNRGAAARRIARDLAGDLDTIILKALKKDPAERYGTVDALAQDLERYRRGEPVLARPDSAWYRARKFISRNKLAAAGTATLVAVIVAAGGISLWQASVAREQTRIAQGEAATAKAVQGFLTEIFNANSATQADPLKAQKTTARELLDIGAARIDEALKDAPQSRYEVLATISDMYVQLSLDAPAADLQRRRVALAREIFGPRDPRVADALLAYIETIQEGPGRPQVPALLQEAFSVLDAAGDTSSGVRSAALVQAARYWRYESLAEFRRAADRSVAFFEANKGEPQDLITALILAGRARANAFDETGAVPFYERSIQAAKAQGAGASAWLATPTLALGDAMLPQLRLQEAEAHFRNALALGLQAYGEGHPNVLLARIQLANVLVTSGRTVEGEQLARDAQATLARPDPRLDRGIRLNAARILASTLGERGRPDLARAHLQADIDEMRGTLPRSGTLAQAELRLAELLALQGKADTSRDLAATASTNWQRFAGTEPTPHGEAAFAIGHATIRLANRQPEDALAALDPSLQASKRDAIRRDILRSQALLMLGQAAAAQSSANAALSAIAALPEGWRPVPLQAAALHERGRALLALGDASGAIASLETALALRRAHDAPASQWHEATALALADAWLARGRADRAAPLRDDAKRLHAMRTATSEPGKK